MSEEEYKKFCKEIIEDETNRLINEKMDSSLIFKYVSALEKKVEKQQKEIENSVSKDKIREVIKEVCNNHDYVDNDFMYDLDKGLFGEWKLERK